MKLFLFFNLLLLAIFSITASAAQCMGRGCFEQGDAVKDPTSNLRIGYISKIQVLNPTQTQVVITLDKNKNQAPIPLNTSAIGTSLQTSIQNRINTAGTNSVACTRQADTLNCTVTFKKPLQ